MSFNFFQKPPSPSTKKTESGQEALSTNQEVVSEAYKTAIKKFLEEIVKNLEGKKMDYSECFKNIYYPLRRKLMQEKLLPKNESEAYFVLNECIEATNKFF